MHNQSNTNNEHSCDSKVATDKGRRRRMPAHTRVRITAEGEHMACGHFIPKHRVLDVKTYNGPIEFYPCPGCQAVDRLEDEMKNFWPKFLIPADLALDLAPQAQVTREGGAEK